MSFKGKLWKTCTQSSTQPKRNKYQPKATMRQNWINSKINRLFYTMSGCRGQQGDKWPSWRRRLRTWKATMTITFGTISIWRTEMPIKMKNARLLYINCSQKLILVSLRPIKWREREQPIFVFTLREGAAQRVPIVNFTIECLQRRICWPHKTTCAIFLEGPVTQPTKITLRGLARSTVSATLWASQRSCWVLKLGTKLCTIRMEWQLKTSWG